MVENESLKVLWDFIVKCDRMVEARGPDIDFMNKQAMEAKIIDIAIPGNARVKDKRPDKYQLPREEK